MIFSNFSIAYCAPLGRKLGATWLPASPLEHLWSRDCLTPVLSIYTLLYTCDNGVDACWRSVTFCVINSLAKLGLAPVAFLCNERERSPIMYVVNINSDPSQG